MSAPPDPASEVDGIPPALRFVLSRRSATMFQGPAPTNEQVKLLLRATLTVPDHGLLRPFRFVIIQGEQRPLFGEALEHAVLEKDPALPEAARQKLREKALLAPMQFVLVFSPRPNAKIPQWEQQTAASCAGYAVLLAAHAFGLGAIWKTSGRMEGARIEALLGLTPEERVLGWINVGHPLREQAPPRAAKGLDELASVLGPSGTRTPLQG